MCCVSEGKNGILRNIASAYLEPELLNGGTFDGDWKVVAYAVTLTKDDDHMDGATVLAVSIGAR